jgi:ATP-dependent DNA helicase RecQ
MKGDQPARLVLPREEGARVSAPTRTGGSPRGSRTRETTEAVPLDSGPVFEALRLLRLELAREESVPAFVVASDRTLHDIARLCPRTLQELTLAHGIGPAKAERYGARVLRAVAEALDEHARRAR